MFISELREFILFGKDYFKARIVRFGHWFEGLKNIVVAFLVVKRGKYSSSFLNTSFLLLVVSAFVAGPIIAENNPFVSSLSQSQGSTQSAEIAYDPTEGAVGTVFSDKPRSTIVEHTVTGGETLESIGKKFGVSADTIKWANDLKSANSIKPGQSLKIPPINGIVHKVASGDSIYSIAKKYQTNAQKIANFPFNDFADLESFSLTPGQILFVPDGVPQEVKPPPSRYIAAQYGPPAGVGSSQFIWPTTSHSVSQYPVSYHMAFDIESHTGNPPIFASAGGTVSVPGFQPGGYGNHVIIDHGNGYQTLYAHLSAITVSNGQSVGQGAQIGVMGSTGRSTGTHLHFEVRSGGALLNPASFVRP